jgi:hypothetical protein
MQGPDSHVARTVAQAAQYIAREDAARVAGDPIASDPQSHPVPALGINPRSAGKSDK